MNIKRELQMMSISDLKAVCRELGVSCPNSKSGIIKRLLLPLKKKYLNSPPTSINQNSSQADINAFFQQVIPGIIIAPNQNNNNMTNQNNNMTNQNNNNTTNQNNNPKRSSEG